MTWEELTEKAKEFGFAISYYLKDYDGVEKEIGYIYLKVSEEWLKLTLRMNIIIPIFLPIQSQNSSINYMNG